jgi:radical SAM superfamily enzyme YgiQ (UPF0313 family)
MLSADQIIDMIEHFIGPETFALGISSTYWSWSEHGVPANILEVMSRVKDKWPQLKIVLGGPKKRKYSKLFDIDFVGEAEDKFTVWCQEQIDKKGLGLFNKKFNIVDLAHRHDARDAIGYGEVLAIELGRGCVFRCKFCGHHNLGKPKYSYQRNHELVLDEMRFNYENFGTTMYTFLDDTVNEDVDKTARLARLKTDLGFNIEWTGYLRADLVWSRKESPQQLEESGMNSCFFGIESFHQSASQAVGKGWSGKHARDFLPHLYHNIWKGKINIYNSFIIGLPGENIDSLRESVRWCQATDIGTHWFNPLSLYVDRKDQATSEFALNYKDYGYFNVDESTGYWENDQMTSRDSLELGIELNAELSKTNRISAFLTASAMNLGFSSREISQWNLDTYFSKCKTKAPSFITDYLMRLKAVKE